MFQSDNWHQEMASPSVSPSLHPSIPHLRRGDSPDNTWPQTPGDGDPQFFFGGGPSLFLSVPSVLPFLTPLLVDAQDRARVSFGQHCLLGPGS